MEPQVPLKEQSPISSLVTPKTLPHHIITEPVGKRSTLQAELNQQIRQYPNQAIQLWFSELNQTKPIATYHASRPMLAASLIKLAILAEALKQKQRNPSLFSKPIHIENQQKVQGSGLLHYIPPQETLNGNVLMYLMITESDNTAANVLISRLGQDNINRYAKQLGLHNTKLRHPFMQPDHMKMPCSLERCNTTSPVDLVILLKHLQQNPEARFILSHQVDQVGIPTVFEQDQVYAKSGTLLHQRSEAAIIEHHGHTYLLVVSIERLSHPKQAKAIVQETLRPIKAFIDRDTTF